MRGLFSSACSVLNNISFSVREAIAKHWSNSIGGSMNGAYLLVPFTRLSMWIEWRTVSVGFGHEPGKGQWEFFAGRLQGVFCIEPVTGQ